MIDRWLFERANLLGLEEAIDCDPSTWTGPIWGTRLKCPICSETCQHAGAYQHIPGRDNYEAGWGGRGDLVIVPVWCEFDHVWQLCFGQHKGATFVFVWVPEQHTEEAA